MAREPTLQPRYGRTGEGLLAAQLGDHGWLMVPQREGYRMAGAWRVRKAMAEWRADDFWVSHGPVADVAGFRAHVEDFAGHERELLGLPRPETGERRATPWGRAQQSWRYGVGVTLHSTAGHGGFLLDALRNAAVHPLLRLEGGWYEEDSDWSRVAFTFPALFTAREQRLAGQTLIDACPDAWEEIHGIALAPGQSRSKDERTFREVHAADWVVVSAVRSERHAGMVECTAAMGGLRHLPERRRFLVPSREYAAGRFGFVIDPGRHAEMAT